MDLAQPMQWHIAGACRSTNLGSCQLRKDGSFVVSISKLYIAVKRV